MIAITKEKASFMSYAFVDDIDLIIGRLYSSTHKIEDILSDMKRAINS
jgi:hypothetical protein